MLKNITVSPAPHISAQLSTCSVMIDVIIALVPAVAAAGYYFRIYAIVPAAEFAFLGSYNRKRLCHLNRQNGLWRTRLQYI